VGLKIPDRFYYALFYCIIAKGHLLVDTHDLGKDGLNTALILSQLIPILVGMKCTLVSCSKMTTPEELLGKIFHLPNSLIESEGINGDETPKKWRDLKKLKIEDILLEIPLSVITPSVTPTVPPKLTKKQTDLLSRGKGPQISQIVVVENLELAPIQTQLTLLEVMKSKRVQVHGFRYSTSELFTVIGVAGNKDPEQSMRLSETMLDSFLMRLTIVKPLEAISQKLSNDLFFNPAFIPKEILALRTAIPTIFLHKDIEHYIRNLVIALRTHSMVANGASPRATAALKAVVRAVSLFSGQKFVTPSHVKTVAEIVLSHRITLKSKAVSSEVIQNVLESVIPPV